ncbi:MAG: SDR family NAD(P)-dependent oxidoreductase [Candidatus Methylomirabilales bacterium]
MESEHLTTSRDLGLRGKLAVVTGAGQGIGRATARLLAAWGAAVELLDLDAAALAAVQAEIGAQGGSAETAQVDVCDEAAVVKYFARLGARRGGLHILVNVVGGGKPAKLADITGADWDRMFGFNVRSCFLCCREAIPRLHDGGRIVNVASLAGRTSSPLQGPHYSAAKAAVIGLTRHLARELGPRGITVNAIAPGATETERIARQMTPARRAELVARIPLGRLATPEDQAGAILFLASSLAAYVTGVTIDVSGGILLG